MALRGQKQLKARAAKILERKILTGASNAQVAREFGITEPTVRRALALAEKADIVVTFEDKLYNELLPLSHEAVASALRGDGEVARAKIGLQVMQGTQVLRPNRHSSMVQQAEDDELAVYVLRKRQQAALEAATVEGQYADAPAIADHRTPHLLSGPGAPGDAPGGAPSDGETGPEAAEIEAAAPAHPDPEPGV